MISEAHKLQLQLKYGLPEALVRSLEKSGEVSSLSPSEVRDHLGRMDIDSSGFLLKYPGNGASTIRLDTPHVNGDRKPQKYLHRKGEPNYVFNPGVDISLAEELWIVEGELKALCGHAQGLLIVGLSGVFNWRTEGDEASLLAEGEKLKDEEALLPELAQVDWEGKKINLLYDSDIVPGHKAYDAFPRLAEQLYRLGVSEVRILSLPSVAQGQKTGLDEFILARGPEQALQDLQAMKSRREPYLPIRAGGPAYAERLIKSESLEDKQKAVVAYLGAKGEVFALDWLKHQTSLQSDVRKALLSEAKKQLKELQAKPRTSSSSQAGEGPQLGPEYDQIKALLKATGEYGLDTLGRLSKEESRFNEKTGELTFFQVPICNFVACPIRDILKDDGLTTERFIEFQGILQGGAILSPVKISGKNFLEMKWLIEAWGIRPAIEPKLEQYVRHALQLMAQAGIPESTVFTHLGWRKIKGSWAFLHAGGAVGSEAVEVEISDRLRKYSLPEETGDIKKALEASLSLLELGPPGIMYPLYALVWLTSLCEPLRQAGIEPSHVTYLWGTTGSFKSTLIALMLSHYGSFEPKGLPANFRDSPKSIEEMAFQAKDTLLVVDDLYPAKDPRERAKLEGVLEYLTRNQGDRQGRGRLKSTIALMSGHPPRGLALCSGETMPLSGSSLARNLVLHLLKEDIKPEKLTQAQAQKSLLSLAMRGYLEYLAPQLDTLPSQLPEDFEYLREQAKQAANKTRTRHRRLDETVAFLFLGFQLFLNYAVAQGALTQEKAVKLLQEAWEAFNQVADELAQVAEREEPTKRFFEALLELQTQGRVYFATMEDVTPDIAERTPGAQKMGWGPDDKGVYYLLYGPAWEQVVKYLRTQEEGLSLSKNSLLDSMEQKGLLDRSQGDRRSIVKKIAENQVRVLPLLEKAFTLEEGENEA
ncbi:MAG: DUF3854 domain-containing protein [Methanothrix soehngenii]|jgi:hypothetical protein|nr:DUF3854 domain-containing protein [Methanothrix soehngenii]